MEERNTRITDHNLTYRHGDNDQSIHLDPVISQHCRDVRLWSVILVFLSSMTLFNYISYALSTGNHCSIWKFLFTRLVIHRFISLSLIVDSIKTWHFICWQFTLTYTCCYCIYRSDWKKSFGLCSMRHRHCKLDCSIRALLNKF